MDASHIESAEAARSRITQSAEEPDAFRTALLRVPPTDRDAWVDLVLGLDELPRDGPDLLAGCVPYLPCSVDVLLRLVEHTPVRSSDVFVDIGSGVGRATALVHLLTGARVVGLEIQTGLVLAARSLMRRLRMQRASCIEGDAAAQTAELDIGTVFFLYCPFSGDRLAKVLAHLELVARAKIIHVCCVDLPLPVCPWLARQYAAPPGDLTIYRSPRI